jgi:hypothetical protein
MDEISRRLSRRALLTNAFASIDAMGIEAGNAECWMVNRWGVVLKCLDSTIRERSGFVYTERSR